MQCSGRKKWLQAQLGTQDVKPQGSCARQWSSVRARSGLTAAVALAAVTNGGGWLLWSRQRLGSAGVDYGSCKGKDAQGYGRAETEVQAETLTAALVTQSCRALALAVAVTAAAEAKKLRAAQSFARGGRM